MDESTPDGDPEDEVSVNQHIDFMKQQLNKSNCDANAITDRMTRTYLARCRLITSGAKLHDVLSTYPALKDQLQVSISSSDTVDLTRLTCAMVFVATLYDCMCVKTLAYGYGRHNGWGMGDMYHSHTQSL